MPALARPVLRLAACGLALLLALSGRAGAQQAPEHELKAAFVYNFIQFTQWPREAPAGAALHLCASGDSVLFPALQALTGKSAAGRPIVLLPLAETLAEKCQVLVATAEDRPRLALIRQLADSGPVLTVTDDDELTREGLMIGMSVQGGRIVFVVDNTRAGKAGLLISSRLLRLARRVQ